MSGEKTYQKLREQGESKEDLVKRAREIGVKGRSTMTKAQLVKALRDH